MISGLKCKACKFRCHRDCEANVPPSCGLPDDLMNFYLTQISIRKEGSPIMPSRPNAPSSTSYSSGFNHPSHGLHIPAYPDSSSNTSRYVRILIPSYFKCLKSQFFPPTTLKIDTDLFVAFLDMSEKNGYFKSSNIINEF